MTPSTATPPGPASAGFCSVAGPHRTGKYASGPLGRKSHQLRDLETFRDARVMNKGGSVKENSRDERRRGVVRTALILAAIVAGIYLFFVGRAVFYYFTS